MRIVVFCHSLLSDWNHGNAHFLRGVVRELLERRHDVRVYEPVGGWSVSNLLAEEGPRALDDIRRAFPWMAPRRYDPKPLLESGTAVLELAVDGADLVLVHEWNQPELIARLGRLRREGGGFTLLFHDTHHRSVSDPEAMEALDLSGYDGVLAFGEVVRTRYLEQGWAARAWTWHEAADTRVFRPLASAGAEREEATGEPEGVGRGRPLGHRGAERRGPGEGRGEDTGGDLVWIGNWGDEERTAELQEFLVGPVARLGLAATVHGVRYPPEARRALEEAGARYRGWVANHRVPEVFARHRMTIHVPRRPYAETLPGIPTIRPFEAMACGIPLVSAPWHDCEGLFRRGRDHLVAHDGREMERHLRDLAHDPELRRELAREGLATVLERHTCSHRVDELLAIVTRLRSTDGPAIHPEPATNTRELTA